MVPQWSVSVEHLLLLVALYSICIFRNLQNDKNTMAIPHNYNNYNNNNSKMKSRPLQNNHDQYFEHFQRNSNISYRFVDYCECYVGVEKYDIIFNAVSNTER